MITINPLRMCKPTKANTHHQGQSLATVNCWRNFIIAELRWRKLETLGDQNNGNYKHT